MEDHAQSHDAEDEREPSADPSALAFCELRGGDIGVPLVVGRYVLRRVEIIQEQEAWEDDGDGGAG